VKKSAFTMLELVFVIVVIGVLAAAIIPRMDRDTLYEASEQLQSHIKYTQHLAMTDNVYQDKVANWFYERWKIDLSNSNQYIVSKGSSATGNHFYDQNVTARDPLSGDFIDGTVNRLYDINDKYSITYSATDGTTTDGILAFDHSGRPYYISSSTDPASSVSNLLQNPLVITLSDGVENATITITPETGYTFINLP
jgi:prepilin-type N-terminal cleavage/methylation domain-containing protein